MNLTQIVRDYCKRQHETLLEVSSPIRYNRVIQGSAVALGAVLADVTLGHDVRPQTDFFWPCVVTESVVDVGLLAGAYAGLTVAQFGRETIIQYRRTAQMIKNYGTTKESWQRSHVGWLCGAAGVYAAMVDNGVADQALPDLKK